ncbi:hypothetical protein KOW79_010255 [Hemibagrus wyckioides]|uniref:Urotensin-2 receptor n=1 Tax=Hemibagrus wyckioides TaxID=337641 RepID=A0A9D3SPG2_9TELE|nr:hypothetical protein KOW79_010255 [Hemibagrus wyckioides]
MSLVPNASISVPSNSGTSGTGSGSSGGGTGNVWVTPLLGATLITMCILGVVGNVYTLGVMRSAVLRRSGSMYVFIVNLAAADLLYLGTIPFVVCTYFFHDWYFGETGCRVLLSLDLLTMHASVFALVAMSLERYRAVASPFRARRSATDSARRHWLAALAIWGAALALTLPMMVMIRLREGRPGASGLVKRICFPTWTPEAFKAYLTVLFFTSMLVPGLVMVVLYTGLARHYWIAQSNLTRGGAGNRNSIRLSTSSCPSRRKRLKHKMAKLFSAESLRSLTPATHTYVNFFVTCLTYGNSCVNPLLYTLLTRNYKDYLAQRGQASSSSRVDQGSGSGINDL